MTAYGVDAAGTDGPRRHDRARAVARPSLHPRAGQVRQEVRHLVARRDGHRRARRQHLHARDAEEAPRDHAAPRRRRLRLAQRRARGATRQALRERQERRGDPQGTGSPVPALPGEPRPGALARALEHARGADRARRLDHLRHPDEEGAGERRRSGEAPRASCSRIRRSSTGAWSRGTRRARSSPPASSPIASRHSQVYSAVFNHVQAIKEEFEDPACAEAAEPAAIVHRISLVAVAAA